MRILAVRFKNLNSLVGVWQVDFTHPSYLDGIFAITGPTGAGKTTVMDAVCLALYGSTPRLGKVTKGSNEIMSRQTGECFAEVTFETAKGRFRCHWSQHRARKRPDGELQQARQEIADADSGKVLESKINQVGEFIEKVTGMNFERFTRSMLLAQGGFAVFLQAPPNERAPILEQITGTEIYSLISMKVHERWAAENEKLALLQAELQGIQVLGESEERELQTALTEKQQREQELTGSVKEMGAALIWLERIAALQEEVEALLQQQQEFEQHRRMFLPELHKLEKSRKALSLEGDYRGIAALRLLQERETAELIEAVALLPEREERGAEALTKRQAAEARLNEARSRQIDEGETIKKVRGLDARLGEKIKQLKEQEAAIRELAKQGSEYRARIENGHGELQRSQTALEAIKAYQAQHASDAALTIMLSAIERGAAALREVEEKRVKAAEQLATAARKQESVFAECGKREAVYEAQRRDYEKYQNDLNGLTAEVVTILQGHDIGWWRGKMEKLKDRERLLMQAVEIGERLNRTSKALQDLKTSREELTSGHIGIMNDVKVWAEQKTLREKEMTALETQVLLLSRIRDLEEERNRLIEGQPCPLCGALEHPYAGGTVPVLNEAEATLQKTKDELKEISDRLSKLEAEQARREAEIGHREKEIALNLTLLETDEQQYGDILVKLNLEWGAEGKTPPEHAELFGTEITTVQANITETAAVVASAEEKEKQQKLAQAALEKARKACDRDGNAFQEARHQRETAILDYERRSADSATLAQELERALAAVRADVEPFGGGQLLPARLDDLLRELRKRNNAWQTKEAEKNVREKQESELKAGIEKYQALLGSLEQNLATRNRERDDLQEEYASLSGERRAAFGEKNADEEERRLREHVDEAGKILDQLRERQGQIEKEINTLREKIASLQEKTNQRDRELAQMEQNWSRRMQAAGFPGEADYLSSLLVEEEREMLAEKERALLQEKTELDARHRDRSEALVAERQKHMTDQAAETLQETMLAHDGELKQLRLDIGGIVKSLSDNDRQRENQAERLNGIVVQKKEAARWGDLHQLIGSADGKKFRNFAQGLTFEMMCAHANRQLRKMTDRYFLIRDAVQSLELNVCDNYQAGEIRSTKNLSGGESFIVSLALALGLSQMASRNVRVDSLFLDEGFGTLDEEALETALETLTGLRQDGKLIGVISHVAALKERISARIEVVPETGGRSILTGPGCRSMGIN